MGYRLWVVKNIQVVENVEIVETAEIAEVLQIRKDLPPTAAARCQLSPASYLFPMVHALCSMLL